MVYLGVLLPVHFDADKLPVHQFSGFLILKTFLFHDMTPVAGSVTDTYQHRLLLSPGFFKGRLSPRKPIHRIMGVLKQIGTVDRKSTRLNSSHVKISYAVFCLKKKNNSPN